MLNFSFEPKLSKELILSRFSEEQIMGYYLKVPIKKGLFRSPLRKDKNPTCSLYRNNSGTLIFKDFATGQNLNVFGVVQTMFNCNYHRALQIIANDFGIIKNKHLPKNQGKIDYNTVKIKDKTIAKIQVEIQDFTEQDLKWWGKYGITPEILKKFNVFSCKHVFLNDNLFAEYHQHCPIYGYYGGKIQENKEKIELWKCYFPKRKEYRFIGNYPAKKLQGYDKLPKKGKVCVITKSQKDVMALYAYGIPACAPNSETVIPSKAIIDDLISRFEYVFALWDNDETGISFLNKMKREYPQLHCLIIPRHYKAKDFSDLRALYGEQETKQFIIKYLKYFKQNEKIEKS
jgi:hypothetical protein